MRSICKCVFSILELLVNSEMGKLYILYIFSYFSESCEYHYYSIKYQVREFPVKFTALVLMELISYPSKVDVIIEVKIKFGMKPNH